MGLNTDSFQMRLSIKCSTLSASTMGSAASARVLLLLLGRCPVSRHLARVLPLLPSNSSSSSGSSSTFACLSARLSVRRYVVVVHDTRSRIGCTRHMLRSIDDSGGKRGCRRLATPYVLCPAAPPRHAEHSGWTGGRIGIDNRGKRRVCETACVTTYATRHPARHDEANCDNTHDSLWDESVTRAAFGTPCGSNVDYISVRLGFEPHALRLPVPTANSTYSLPATESDRPTASVQ